MKDVGPVGYTVPHTIWLTSDFQRKTDSFIQNRIRQVKDAEALKSKVLQEEIVEARP